MSELRLVCGRRPLRGARCAAAASCMVAAALAAADAPPTSAPAGPADRPPASAPAATTAPATTAPAAPDAALPLRKDGSGLPTLGGAGHGDTLGRMVAYAMVILVLGAGAVFVARKYFPRGQAGGAGRLRVIDSIYLAPRKQLHILQAGRQRFLVASCRDSVHPIAELTDSFAEVYEEQVAREGSATAGEAAEAGAEEGSA